MPPDHLADPWSGTTIYHGFSGALGPVPGPFARRTRRRGGLAWALLGAGAAAALGLGAVFGLAARPQLAAGDEAGPTPPAAAAPAMEASTPPVVATSTPAAIPVSLAPPPAAASQPAAPVAPPKPARRPGPVRNPAAPKPDLTEPAGAEAAPTERDAAAPAAAAEALPIRADCALAGTEAEQMVCSNPLLSDADRRLAYAYRRALQSDAIPPADLRREQQDWIAIREEAARQSPQAVASIYEQRIAELNAIAQAGAP